MGSNIYKYPNKKLEITKTPNAENPIVHGHTPEKNVVNFPYRINIDTGCYFSGKLSCVCLNDINDERNFITT